MKYAARHYEYEYVKVGFFEGREYISGGKPPSEVMVIVWRLRGNIIRTAPCWVV